MGTQAHEAKPQTNLTLSLESSIIFLKSSFACMSLFFFSFLSSSARVFTNWSNTCRYTQVSVLQLRNTQLFNKRPKHSWPASSLWDWEVNSAGQTRSCATPCPTWKRLKPVGIERGYRLIKTIPRGTKIKCRQRKGLFSYTSALSALR